MNNKELYNKLIDLDYFKEPLPKTMSIIGMTLSAIGILFSSLHFWPFAESKKWQMFCLPNIVVFIWITILVCYFTYRKGKWKHPSLLPHISVLAYLTLNILSIAFANDTERAINFTAKLTLMLIGGYTLFNAAISGKVTLRLIYILACSAVSLSVFYCFLERFILGNTTFGFFDNPYKYGTYIGILVPLAVSYLFFRPQRLGWLFASLLMILAILTCGTLGGIAAIISGTIVLAIIIRGWLPRTIILLNLVIAIGLIVILSNNSSTAALLNDTKLLESDNINLKQRYIEWQAEINLLEERTVPGTAAGSINDYRSSYYYRLPKLNTLKSFDQNGWTATGAETGFLGLVCFCWIISHYFRLSYKQLIITRKNGYSLDYKYASISFISLISVLIANLFSSIHYNGILIVFVLILVLISKNNIFDKGLYENYTNL